MKRILPLFLTLILLGALLSGFATAEEPPFAEQHGLTFVAPHAWDGLRIASAADDPLITCREWSGSIDAPVLSRSLPDEDGRITYTVSCTKHAGVELQLPEEFRPFRYGCITKDGLIYDYYTGQQITPGKTLSTVENVEDRSENTTILRLDGKRVEVSLESAVSTAWGLPAQDERFFRRSVTQKCTYILRVPADYDGLMLGIDLASVTQYHGFDEAGADERGEAVYWNSANNADDWEFIRLNEYAPFPTLRVGDTGPDVELLQNLLNVQGITTVFVDGAFGSGTEVALIYFQQLNGLPVTGMADNDTLVALMDASK